MSPTDDVEAGTSPPNTDMPRISFSSMRFSDGTTIDLEENDIVVLVGPNNAGKSEVLRNLNQKLQTLLSPTPVITDITISVSDEIDALLRFITSNFKPQSNPDGRIHYNIYGSGLEDSSIRAVWGNILSYGTQSLNQLFISHLNCEYRLNILQNTASFNRGTESPQTPLQLLYVHKKLENSLSTLLKKAFGVGMAINRHGGTSIPVHIGAVPELRPQEDSADETYQDRLAKLPLVDRQGDGLKSFLGILLNVISPHQSIFLIDEPESFLHPPQAKEMGRALAGSLTQKKQLFIATHSNDILKGLIESGSQRLKVIRITRTDDGLNIPTVLTAETINQLWSNPVLRYSNVYDGLFHDITVITENERDSRFYNAVIDGLDNEERKPPDIFFTDGAGKGGIPAIASSLKALGVNIRIVTDIDALSNEGEMRNFVTAMKGNWDEIKPSWRIVNEAISLLPSPIPATQAIRDRIDALFDQQTDSLYSKPLADNIKIVTKFSSVWHVLKRDGLTHLHTSLANNPTALDALNQMLSALHALGIFIVPVGELESFCPSVSGKKGVWLNNVLLLDNFNTTPHLQRARDFCKELIT